MGPDQFHQYPCADTAHRMSPPPPAHPKTQPNLSKLIFKRTRHHANVS